ncbi:MAG: hypothetical protein N2258_07820 [Brevinematales bacterium]|nr:hypothetical protein [Brevinematales bacterium]
MKISDVIKEFPQELREPVIDLVDVIRTEMGITREDFSDLKEIVRDLAEARV